MWNDVFFCCIGYFIGRVVSVAQARLRRRNNEAATDR